MTCPRIIAAAALGATATLAQDLQSNLPGFDASRVAFSATGNMDLGFGNGELDITTLSLRSFLCQPITPAEGIYILPQAEYSLNSFNFSGTTGPFQDEDLHLLGLSAYVLSMRPDTPWIWGAWGRAKMATDFQHIDGDDFSFDLAAGVGYRFNPGFTIGVGGAITNLNGESNFYPGINFDWIVNDQVRVGIYGPTAVAAYAYDDNWLFSARFDIAGGVWNITDNLGQSRTIDLTDYRLGLYASRRLVNDLWLTVGAGITLGNELDYATASGTDLFNTDPDSALFGVIALRMKVW